MDGRAIRGKTLFAAAVFVASVLVLTFKLLNPAPIQLLVQGQTVIMSQVPGLFTYTDVLVISIASGSMCASAAYLVLHDSLAPTPVTSTTPKNVHDSLVPIAPASPEPGNALLEERRKQLEEVAKTLKGDEQVLFRTIINECIINQRELVDRTGLPKSNVSRALYVLESRGLVERRRQGMGNVVLLK